MIDVVHQVRPKPGEHACGDLVHVARDSTAVVFAVVDVCGHGPNAAAVADRARAYLSERRPSPRAQELLLGLHDALRGTRGAAAFVGRFDGRMLECVGVGNVEARARPLQLRYFPQAGLLGHRVPDLRAQMTEVTCRARVAVFSDGLHPALDLESVGALGLVEACSDLMDAYARGTDDASLLLAELIPLHPEPR
jgi:negative regulator of sigma-B (phosphoserine phosphatase)